ncbi:hypothetical protein ASD15_27675 [Massilia sp. Root351]|nr:hypothetical protein ASD15_27675 [Massilia sp. Root351]
MQYALRLGDGVIKVTGEAGSGKTMLCGVLAERLAQSVPPVQTVLLGQTVFAQQAPRSGAGGPGTGSFPLSAQDAVCGIARQLGLAPGGMRNDEVMRMLYSRLAAERAAGRRAVLLVEESQLLPADTLETLRQLTNLNDGANNLLPVVLLGTPELSNVLRQPRLRQLRERITLSFVLPPLPSELVPELLAHRLRMAGHADGALFQLDAAKLIARTAGADLRALIALADKSLSVAAQASAPAVAMFHVRDAIKGVPAHPAPPIPSAPVSPEPVEAADAPGRENPAATDAPPADASLDACPLDRTQQLAASPDELAVEGIQASASVAPATGPGDNTLAESTQTDDDAASATDLPPALAPIALGAYAAQEPVVRLGDAASAATSTRSAQPPAPIAAQARLFAEDASSPALGAPQAAQLSTEPSQAQLLDDAAPIPAQPPAPEPAALPPAPQYDAAATLQAAFAQTSPPRNHPLKRNMLVISGAMLAVAGVATAAFLFRPAIAPASIAAAVEAAQPAAATNTVAASAQPPVQMALPPDANPAAIPDAPPAVSPAARPSAPSRPAQPAAPPSKPGLLKQSLAASKTWLRDEPDNNFCVQIANFPASESARAEKFLADTRAAIGLSEVHSYPMLINGARRIAIVYGSFASAKKVMEVQAELAERSGTHHKIRTIKGIRQAVAKAAGKAADKVSPGKQAS